MSCLSLTILIRKVSFTKAQLSETGKLPPKWITFILLFLIQPVWGQHDIKPTDGFMIAGQVEQEMSFKISDIGKYSIHPINDVVITNHAGEKKGTATKLKGVLVKDILDQVQFKVESPKQLSEFFFTFVASDGYKVVYSWNELFNTATGDHTFLITEMDGMSISQMEDRMLIVSSTDFKTGRRHLKGLSKIIVGRVQ